MTGTRKHYNDGFEGPPLEAGITWFDPASAGSPKGGDAQQAPSRSDNIAVGEADAPNTLSTCNSTTIGERQAIARGVQFGDARYPDRFWARVTVQDDGCWVWGGVRARGYGNISINGKNTRVHRAALTLIGVHVPPIMVVDHMCRNRACVNPDHLRVVSPRTNALENNIGPTAKNAVKTHCPAGHALIGDNVYKDRKNWRSCVTCKMEATYRYKHGKGADLKARRERALEEHREAQAAAQEMGFPTIMEALRSKNTTTSAPVAETTPDKLREMLLAVEDFINEPQRNRDIEPMEVRDYRHELYRKWSPLCQAILALGQTLPIHGEMREALEAAIGRLMNIAIDAETGETKRVIAANARRAADLARNALPSNTGSSS